MALLDTIKMIEDRRERVMNRRQRQLAQGEKPSGIAINPMQLREAMSKLNDTFQKNRRQIVEERDRQARMNQAMQRFMQEEEARKGGQGAPQPAAPAPQQPQQMNQPQGLLGGMGGMQQPQNQGMLGMAQSPTSPFGG